MIPGRTKILTTSWLFVVASALLLAEFVVLEQGLYRGLYYAGEPKSWATTYRANVLGATSCVCWFVGFAMLVDWIVFDVPSRGALYAATCKLIAALLFNIQPFSGLLDDSVLWSNFVAICFFHFGNSADLFRLWYLVENYAGHGAMPFWGMFAYTVATAHLVVGNAIEYFSLPDPPPHSPHISHSELKLIAPCQITGAILLVIGSCIYVKWASHKPKQDELAYPLTA